MQQVCNVGCALEFNSKKNVDTRVREMKKKLKTHQEYIVLLQTLFNAHIRNRDRQKPCISCGGKLTGKFDAGHYFSCGAYPNLRFNEDNVHGQCVRCNQHLHGNLIEYTPGLIKRIGQERYDKLHELKNQELKLSVPELHELIKKYRNLLK